MARRCIELVRSSQHGDLPRWLSALRRLPRATPSAVSFEDAVSVGAGADLAPADRARLGLGLRELMPWRKGPFNLFGIEIDAEWRSDRKWARIASHIDLDGRHVLDVGCGNGYYGWRMLAAGARTVTGIDPSLLAVAQHGAVACYAGRARDRAGSARNLVLPLRLADFPPAQPFDAIFSMGVVYHCRDGARHVRELARHAHRDTTLVLESLVVDEAPLVPRARYARMRNAWLVPDVPMLLAWLREAGFANAAVVDVSTTATDEQRTTAWMPFQSLAAALDPAQPERTIEGYPAPKRAVIIARQ